MSTTTEACIFCSIAQGETSSRKILETDAITAFLDIHPHRPGHTIIVTKAHYQILPSLPDEISAQVWSAAQKISHLLIRTLGPDGITGTAIFIANGAPAGQRAQHLLIHIIPQTEDDKLFTTQRTPAREQDILDLAQRLRNALSQSHGEDT